MESPTHDEQRGTKSRAQILIAGLAGAAIVCHLLLRPLSGGTGSVLGLSSSDLPLVTALLLGGIPLVLGLLLRLFRREFGSDLLASISIVTSALLGQYLAGTLVVLMLSGGEALEAYAVRSAASVLAALARRMPSIAHRKVDGRVIDVALTEVTVGETLSGSAKGF